MKGKVVNLNKNNRKLAMQLAQFNRQYTDERFTLLLYILIFSALLNTSFMVIVLHKMGYFV